MKRILTYFLLLLACRYTNSQTVLTPGDVLLISLKSDNGGGTKDNDITYICFKDITPGTFFDITDNGFERNNANRWGTTEGIFRITRTTGAPVITAGTPINIVVSGSGSSTTITVNTCGSPDVNWAISDFGGQSANFQIAPQDNLWILTGGNWDITEGSNRGRYLNGIPLFGYKTANSLSSIWSSPGFNNDAGTTPFQNADCLSYILIDGSNSTKRVKYSNTFTSANQATWIARITGTTWTSYSNNSGYNGFRNYTTNTCSSIVFPISPTDTVAEPVYGTWVGGSNTDWFDCRNWSGRVVPDSTKDVVIPTNAANRAIISGASTLAARFGNHASCRNLTLYSNARSLTISHSLSGTSTLTVKGNITIEATATGIHAPGGRLVTNDSASGTPDGTIYIFGNWNNKVNTNQYDEGEGTVIFKGNTASSINTSDATGNETFFNLRNIKTADITLLKDVTVINTLQMAGEHFVTGSNTLRLGISNSQKGTLSYTSGYVIGKMRRWFSGTNSGDASSLFPIATPGNQSRFVRVSYTTAPTTGGHLTASFNATDPGLSGLPIVSANTGGYPYDILNINPGGYWQMDNQTGALTDGQYTISCTGEGFSGFLALEELTLVKRVGSNPWTAPGTHLAATGSMAAPVVSRSGVTGWSNFAFGQNSGGALPVTLVLFNATKVSSQVYLHWATATEINSSHYEIQRSVDGVNFETIGTELAAYNSVELKNYQFIDNNPHNGLNYYRLKMVDADETFEYSPVRAINFNAAHQEVSIAAYPNPATGYITISTNQPVSGPSSISIFNVNGKEVYAGQMEPNMVNAVIDLNGLPAGTYFAILYNSSGKQVAKFAKIQ